jgi:hypothetical protein
MAVAGIAAAVGGERHARHPAAVPAGRGLSVAISASADII